MTASTGWIGQEDLAEDCPHERTLHDPDLDATTRLCTDCGAHLVLTPDEAERLTIRDDGAYYVTDEDALIRFAGPFLVLADALTAQDQEGRANPDIITEVHHLLP